MDKEYGTFWKLDQEYDDEGYDPYGEDILHLTKSMVDGLDAVSTGSEEPQQRVSFLQLFRFADGWDRLLIFLGSLTACIHGGLFVSANIVLGTAADVYHEFEEANTYINSFSEILGEYGVTSHDVWSNKTILDVIGAMEGNPDMNSSYIPSDLDEDTFMRDITVYTLYFCVMAAGVLVCAFGQISFWCLAAERQMRRIRSAFFRAVLIQDIAWFDSLQSGQLNSRFSDDMLKLSEGIGKECGVFLHMTSMSVIAFAQAFFYGWKMTLVMITIVPVLMAAGFVYAYLNTSLTEQELTAYAKAGQVAEEVLGAIRTVAAFGGERKEGQRYRANLYEARRHGIRKGFIIGLGMGIAYFALYASYALSLWYGSKLVREDDNYTPGVFLIVLFSVMYGATSLGQAAPKLQATSTARGAAAAIFAVIDRTPRIDSSSSKGIMLADLKGNIELKNVHFHYPNRPEVPVLRGFCLTAKMGETVALVGSSGGGKSTVTQLLQRFYDVDEGEILLDGVNICGMNVDWLRRQIGVVSQEPVLFGMSIRENIRCRRRGISDDDVEQAARQANAHDFIIQLPEKYNTHVGDRGAHLSGGQKQRIAIARALVTNPGILVLDEATSALDNESEATVQAALDKASEGRTTIVIAHRLSTIRHADVIYSVQDGAVVESGSHSDLLRSRGLYHQLIMRQGSQVQDLIDYEGNATDSQKDLKLDGEGMKEPLHSDATRTQTPTRIATRMARSMSNTSRGRIRLRTVSTAEAEARQKQEEKEEEGEEGGCDDLGDVEAASLWTLMKMNSPEWPFIVFGCVASFINGAEPPFFAVVIATHLGAFYSIDQSNENLTMTYDFSTAITLIGGVVVMVTRFMMHYMFGHSGERLTMRVRDQSFRAMLRQDMAYFDQPNNRLGVLTTRLSTEAAHIQGATGSRLGLVLQNISGVLVGLALAFLFSWKLTLALLLFAPLIVIAGMKNTSILAGAAISDKKELENAGKVALEAVGNIRTVVSLAIEEQVLGIYKEKLKLPFRNGKRKALSVGLTYALSQCVQYFCFAVAMYYGAILVRNNENSFGEVYLIMAVIYFGSLCIGEGMAFSQDYSKAKISAGQYLNLIHQKPNIDIDSPLGVELVPLQGLVRMSKVHFRYENRPEVPVLCGLDLEVSPGQMLALVGESGCGKSTTVSLIERFYDPTDGHVMLDDRCVKELNLRWLRSQIGIVSQEPVLFDRTIRENIAYGDNSREASMHEIIDVAKIANIHAFIVSLPQGYETRVGSRGAQLSGGQKQRVAIARALLSNPKILLLDEVTSALDTESEQVVQEALNKARCGRTTIVIAHRISAIQDADQIVVIDGGKVVEVGTHQQLLQRQGHYYNLHNQH